MTENEFRVRFNELTGNPPLLWQERLFQQFIAPSSELPSVIDLPTGLGKTMVMAIWLIARMQEGSTLPRRLIYVVDRRTVVDQATDLAIRLQKGDGKKLTGVGADKLAISTLRGQLADNREWSRDPSKLAIIIGTVDLIGSALLFSGYRSSFKTKPLHAGMIGQDSLLILDEAHLSKPFEKLICAISDRGIFQKTRDDKTHSKPMRVISMSATSGRSSDPKPPFTLRTDANGNLSDDDAKDPIVSERFNAQKRLTIITLNEKEKLNDALVMSAVAIAQKPGLQGKRVVVFVRKPDDARAIAEAIRKHGEAKTKPGAFTDSVEVLTGTMRGLERDNLVERPVLKRFLNGSEKPELEENKQQVFLISTSAGEVGFDLNADHMICDATTIDSLIQRLGRVNRRGGKDKTAIVRLFAEKNAKAEKPLDKAIANATSLLRELQQIGNETYNDVELPVYSASPSAIRAFKENATVKSKLAAASTPDATTVALTDILLDAWSMTSITESMPGRPEVAPWIRGLEVEQAQTTVAWRAELELFKDVANSKKMLKAVFAKHRIRPHETVTTNSSRVVDFLKGVTTAKNGLHSRPELHNTVVGLKFPRNVETTTIGNLLDNPGILYAEPTLILPPRFGGLDPRGMLSHESIPPIFKPNDPPTPSLDVADEPGYEPLMSARSRIRILIERADDKWKPMPLPAGQPIGDLNFDDQYDSPTLLFQALARAGLRVRLVQPIGFDNEGDATRSLICLEPLQKKSPRMEQKLVEHVGAVELEARRMADALSLTGSLREALLFAAKWHDEGKKADIWQRFIGRQNDSDEPLGKSAVTRDPKSLRGYRHEFGSLLRVNHPERNRTASTLPADADARELSLHLIATHHGFGRPHFDNTLVKEFSTEECETLHTEMIRRFAGLQRTYGHWHLAWIENLLRCADGAASEPVTGSPDEQEDDAAEADE